MAVTAKFLADFDQFVAAAKGAEVSLKNVETGAAKIGTSMENLKGVAASLAGAFGIGFSAAAVVSFGKELFAAADELTKLHDKTGISVEGLQRFQVAGDDAGNSIDDLTNAIVKMEDKLVGGDKAALGALDKLGLSFEDLKTLTPEQQFIAISDAIRLIHDPATQVNIAIDLFGKTGANVLPTLKRGFDDLKDSAVGMSREIVKVLDDAGDAMMKFWRSAKGAAGTGLGTLLLTITDSLGLEAAKKALDDAAASAHITASAFKSLAVPGLPADLAKLRQMEDDLTTSAEASIVAHKAFAASLKAVQDIETNRNVVRETGLLGLSAAEQKASQDILTTWLTGNAAVEQADKSLADFIAKTSLDSLNYEILKIWERVDEEEKAFAGSEAQRAAYNAAVEALATEQAQALRNTADAAAAATEASAARQVAAIRTVTGSYWEQIDAAARAAGVTVIGNRPGEGPGINGALPGGTGFTLTGGTGFSNGGLHPLRDVGGPVSAGTSYLIGMNRQPELFTPGASGFISPMGGGASVNVTIYVNGTAADVAKKVADEIMRTAKSARQFGAA